MLKVIAAASVLLAAAAPAAAQTAASATGAQASKAKDPNRIICYKEETIGTRIGARKVCKTALEWQQQRQEQRESLEKIQQVKGIQKSN